MRRDIITAAKRIKRKLRGNISFEKAEQYIQSKGYSVICCNDSTDEVKRFGLVETLQEHPAITYQGDVYMIFINRHYTYERKLRLLLHEIAHIELGHFDNKALSSEEKEQEANSFVYELLDRKTPDYSKAVLVAMCILLLVWRFGT